LSYSLQFGAEAGDTAQARSTLAPARLAHFTRELRGLRRADAVFAAQAPLATDHVAAFAELAEVSASTGVAFLSAKEATCARATDATGSAEGHSLDTRATEINQLASELSDAASCFALRW
jgi:hypothetical protein